MTPLTDEQKRAYLADPNKCPYCGDAEGCDTSAIPDISFEDGNLDFTCNDCDRSWQCAYTLTSIEESEE